MKDKIIDMENNWNSAIYDKAPFGVILYQLIESKDKSDLIILQLNAAFEKLSGISASNLINKKTSVLQLKSESRLFLLADDLPKNKKQKVLLEYFSDITNLFYSVTAYNIESDKYVAVFNEGSIGSNGNAEPVDSIFSNTMTSIAKDTSDVTGEVYFQRLVLNIHKFLDADYVLLAEHSSEEEEIYKTFAACHYGKIVTNFDINISNLEFRNKLSENLNVESDLFQKNDAEDELIIFNGNIMGSYISIPLLNKKNKTLGVMMIFFNKSVDIPEAYIDLVRIFASRAAAEKDRLNSEEKIKESENKFRILADYNYDWEYWIGNQGKYIYVSPSCYRITGYKAEEFLQDPELLDHITLAEYRRELEEQAPNALSADSFHNSIEIQILDKSGTKRWISRTCNLLYDDNGDYWGIRGNIRDVTQKKQMELALWTSERKFRNIFNISQEGIVISDITHNILEINKSFLDTVSFSRKELKKTLLSGIIHPIDQDAFIIWKENLSRMGNTIETKVETDDGSKIMEVSGKLIDYIDSKAHLTIFRDITERKNIQAKILNTIIATEEKERMRIAQDLHDGLGPLLSTIKLYTNSILNAKDDENKKIAVERSIETVDEAIISLKGISNNLSPHILRDFGLIVAVESFIKRFTDTNDIQIKFTSTINDRFNPNYEVTLFRIVIELINNTYKHAEAKNITIDLSSVGDILELKYKDNGKGFDYEKIMKTPDGNGLFNIVSRIKSIDGDIWFNTKPGKGFKTHIIISEIFSQM